MHANASKGDTAEAAKVIRGTRVCAYVFISLPLWLLLKRNDKTEEEEE